jgi:hypothetical protein
LWNPREGGYDKLDIFLEFQVLAMRGLEMVLNMWDILDVLEDCGDAGAI